MRRNELLFGAIKGNKLKEQEGWEEEKYKQWIQEDRKIQGSEERDRRPKNWRLEFCTGV